MTWTMLGLAREYRLFNGKQIVGLLKSNFSNRKSYGELRGYLARFEKEGFFGTQARILDIEGEKVLGTLEFDVLARRATIRHEGERYDWRPGEKRGTWSVGNADDRSDYRSSGLMGNDGVIEEAYLPPVVLLAGLYVHGYFLKRRLIKLAAGFSLGLALGYFATAWFA